MPDDGFKRSLAIVALLHLCLVAVFFVTSRLGGSDSRKETIAWLDGSIGGGEAGETPDLQPVKNEALPRESAPELIDPLPPVPPVPEPAPVPLPPPPPDQPLASEIVTATPAPVPAEPTTPRPTTPKPATPRVTPKPKPKATPKATPRTTPKATAKPATPKPKATPADAEPGAAGSPATASPSPKNAKATPGGKSSSGDAMKLAFEKTRGGNGPGEGNGRGNARTGAGEGTSQFGWYYSMIHDRFHARWEQPTSIERTGDEIYTLLLLRIDREGHVIAREIQKSSGVPQMDESVLTAAEKVRQIDPLPEGLGTNGVFEVSMKFRLDQQ